ncbi:MAG: histidine--tRNA ligase [Candidatus Woesearchaeota archaeon]
MQYQRIKGAEDFYPKEEALREYIYRKLDEQARKFGFQRVDMPAIETVKLLTAKSGEEIRQQIFVLEKRGTEELGLRFDLTVPMTRMFVAKQRELPKPVKWYSINKMWRYEAPQAGRLREFSQLSVELFGTDKPEADAQCINLMIACFEALGLTSKDITIKINNRKLLEGLLLEVVSQDKLADVVRIIDKSGKIGEIEFAQELKKLGIDLQKIEVIRKITRCQGPASILSTIKNELKPNALAIEGLAELEKTLALVDKKYMTVNLSIARGLAYYTGNVYECFDREGKYRALAGGGRYDQLVQLLGGEVTPATGFAIGMETLRMLLEDKKLLPKVDIGPEYYVAPVNEKLNEKAREIVNAIRKKTTADIDLMRRGLTKQIEYAAAIGAKKIVIVGEKDLAENKITVRELESGKEEKVLLRTLLQE